MRDGSALDAAIAEHDVVVSLVPWQLHPDVARACIKRKVDMVTTSYVSPAMEAMDADAKAAGITILNEIGLDPGIDHLGAMRVSTTEQVALLTSQVQQFSVVSCWRCAAYRSHSDCNALAHA